ncbi:MAG: exopolysaccharide biosynthesis polyprenyl glycosylphosphotransferase [Oscillospiraceae bacterium]|nr:exopolysaccharide biosynthesis polyprenyl glycosylphosphotransferase [Candidatus Equicaccousia limihippi]
MKYLLKFRKSFIALQKVLLIAAMTCIFIASWQTSYQSALFSDKGNYLVVLSYLFLIILFANIYGGFKIGVKRLNDVVYSLCLSTIFTNFIMYIELCLIARMILPFIPTIIYTIIQCIIVAIGCYCTNTMYYRIFTPHKIVAIKNPDSPRNDIIDKMKRIGERYSIEKIVSCDMPLNEILSEIDDHEAVLICDFDKTLQNKILRYSYATKKRIYYLPNSNDIVLATATHNQIMDTPIFICRNHGLTTEQRIVKRFLDIVISAIGLIITSPIMIGVAIAIKCCDHGPVFFKQNRITRDGKIFNVLKFRSMIVNADQVELKKSTSNDDRITPVGKIIRPLRIDELPQLINILFGDMSFVGPRPERTENVYEYTKMYPEFNLRHKVKGGLTGYAQIYGKYNTTPQDKLNMDLLYIEKYSLLLDIKLVFMTIKIIFQKESTEGFTEEASKIGEIAHQNDVEEEVANNE